MSSFTIESNQNVTDENAHTDTHVSLQKDINNQDVNGILAKIKARSEKVARLRIDQEEEIAEPTDFEKRLFEGKAVDFENYIECNELFGAFNKEALEGIDVRYVDYQQSLLNLLQHCYGYFYVLKRDSERYEADIKYIDLAIKPSNIHSNKSNHLSAKIIKLAWAGSKIDRRRINDYAKLLDNAWCQGPIRSNTDGKGSVLPKFFSIDVMEHGGITSYSRMSFEQVKEQNKLEEEGYDNINDKRIDIMRDAIAKEEFTHSDTTIPLKCESVLSSDNPFSTDLRDGERICALLKWDLKNERFKVVYNYKEGGKDGIVDKAELALYNMLKEHVMPKEKKSA